MQATISSLAALCSPIGTCICFILAAHQSMQAMGSFGIVLCRQKGSAV